MNMLKNIMKFARLNKAITFYFLFLTFILCAQLLFSNWPGGLVGGSVFLMLLVGAIEYNILEGSLLRLRAQFVFIFALLIFWGSPLCFFFTDYIEWIQSRLYGMPEMCIMLPFGVVMIFGSLYLGLFKIHSHQLRFWHWLAIWLLSLFLILIYANQLNFSLYAFYVDQYGRLLNVVICILYSLFVLIYTSIPWKRLYWTDLLIDGMAIFLYSVLFRSFFLMVLAFCFKITVGRISGNDKARWKSLLFWHIVLLVLPLLGYHFRSNPIWNEAQSFRVNSFEFLVIYELLAFVYAVVTIMREKREVLKKY